MAKKYLWILLAMMSFFSSAQVAESERAISKVLDTFHHAAAKADAKQYLNLLTDDAIFLGTDGSERWNKQQFSDFVLPYFTQGKGWLYVVKERNISLLKKGTIAFFDEVLDNKSYGHCRGSGVLIKTTEGWKISQYSLSLLVPNGVANKVVEQIKHYEQQK